MTEICYQREKDSTIVQCLLKCWLKAWNSCGQADAAYTLSALFLEGDNAIEAKAEAFGKVITARSFEEYKTKWIDALEDFDTFEFELDGKPEVAISDDRSDISFGLTARGRRRNGAPLEPKPRWRGEHVWRLIDGEWRLVSERLTSV